MRSQSVQTILLFVRVHRFGNAVTVENKARTGSQLYLAFRIVSASQSQGQAALYVEKTCAAVFNKKWTQVSGIGEGHRTRGWVEHAVDHGHEFSGREIVYQHAIKLGQNLGRTATGLRQRP